MTLQSLQTIAQLVVAFGLILSAIGGYGVFYFGRKIDEKKISSQILLNKNDSLSKSSKETNIVTNQNNGVIIGEQNISYTVNNKFEEGNLKKDKESSLLIKITPKNLQLEELLINNDFKIVNLNATYNLVLTYTGEIEEIGGNLYRYRGGNLQLKINGEECHIFNNLIIEPTFLAGNSKQNTQSKINTNINEIVIENIKEIYSKIKTCIKHR